MVILLLVLETSQYPSGLCPEEVALLVSLDAKYPSSSHIVLRFDIPHVSEITNLIVNPGFVLKMFRFSKLFLVSSYFLGCHVPWRKNPPYSVTIFIPFGETSIISAMCPRFGLKRR